MKKDWAMDERDLRDKPQLASILVKRKCKVTNPEDFAVNMVKRPLYSLDAVDVNLVRRRSNDQPLSRKRVYQPAT